MRNLHIAIAFVVLSLLSVVIAITLNFNQSEQQATIGINAQQASPTTTVLANNLEVPWALGFLPDGNILFTERTGKVKLLNLTTGTVTTITTITGVKAQAESGLLGLAINPQYATNNFVYLYYSYAGSGGTQNRVVRYTFANNQLSSPTTIIDGIPGSDYHNGGRLRFGPDGFLYVTTGDGNDTSTPQNINSLGGKILRVKDDGTAAPGNPFNNRVWSYGHRNPQGIAWDGNILYATEHGPSQPSCCDELNRIVAGKNYGWPDVKGNETKTGTEKSLLNSGNDSNSTWAPSGATFYNGSVFFAGLRGQALYEATVQGATATIKAQHFKNQLGRIRDVVVGPDNALYIATGNKSSQGGSAQPEDDKILKVSFPGTANPTFPPPQVITPTLYCLSGVPCTGPSITPGGKNPAPTSNTTPPVGGNPNQPSNPNPPTSDPCLSEQTSSLTNGGKKKKKYRENAGGFFQRFFEFLLRLIELILERLGLLPPSSGNPGTTPNNPDPSAPCPEPTSTQKAPTVAPQPTTVQSTIDATPTLFGK